MSRIDLLKTFIDIAKIYSPSGREQELAKYILNIVKEYSDDAYIDNVGNVIAIKGSGRPIIWLHAHMDTIPTEPRVEIYQDKIVGSGIADDKAPLTCMLKTFIEIENFKGKIVFTGVVEEETTSRGSINLVKDVEEKILEKPDGVIIGEPTGIDKIVYTYRGSLKIRIISKARGGHASTPISSTNPILKIYEIYQKIFKILDAGYEYNKVTIVPTVVKSSEVPNQIPKYAEMILDVRIPPKLKCSDIIEKIRDIKDVDSTSKTWLEYYECVDPVQVDIMNIMARALTRAIIKILGRSPIPAKKWGTSDMNIIVKICNNIIAYGPGEHETLHTDEEVVYIRDLEYAVKIYSEAIIEFEKLYRSLEK